MDKSTIIDILTDANTCFLIGAGCSKCAGKPLMVELTAKVKEKLTDDGKKVLENLNGPDGKSAPTVEDLTNQLLQLKRIIAQRKTPLVDGWDIAKIEAEIKLIQKEVVSIIGTKWESNKHHEDFLERLSQNIKKPRDIFLLNYDTLLEAGMDKLKLGYADGFRGSENAHFDPNTYLSTDVRAFNIYKLHGSVNWIRNEDNVVRRRPLLNIKEEDARHVIYPAEQKYLQTQYGVYEILLKLFRERLRKDLVNNRLVVLGYSFSDEHINIAIEDSILAAGSNLTVFAFIGGSTSDTRKDELREMVKRCDNRLNFIVGDKEYIGTGLNKDECESFITTVDLSRFENIVSLLTGK
jgi:hypothetical protein